MEPEDTITKEELVDCIYAELSTGFAVTHGNRCDKELAEIVLTSIASDLGVLDRLSEKAMPHVLTPALYSSRSSGG